MSPLLALPLVLLSLICWGAEGDPPASAPPSAALEALKSLIFSPEDLGLEILTRGDQKTAKWKERISPREPVEIQLLKPNSKFSTLPRIAVRVNRSQVIPLVIDTGAAVTLIDSGSALKSGIKIADPEKMGNTFKGLAGEEQAFYGMIDILETGNLTFKNSLTAIRLLESPDDDSVDNLLGMTSLGKFKFITLDFPKRKARFSLEHSFAGGEGKAATRIPFELYSLQIVVELKINQKFAFKVLLDTGNDAPLMLGDDLLEQIGLAEEAQKGKKGKFQGLGGAVETKTFKLALLELGDRTFKKVEVVAIPGEFPPTLGSGFLRKHKSTIDFERQILWLE